LGTGLGADGQSQGGREDDAEDDVEPEDRPPVGHGEHRGAEQRTQNAPELLHGADHTQRRTAPVGWPQVGDDRQGCRDQTAAADALKDPPADEDGKLDRYRGDGRTDHEDAEAGEQHTVA